jgi:hypothetical protein
MVVNDELGYMGREFLGLILRYYSGIFPEELRETTKELRSRMELGKTGISGISANSDIQYV